MAVLGARLATESCIEGVPCGAAFAAFAAFALLCCRAAVIEVPRCQVLLRVWVWIRVGARVGRKGKGHDARSWWDLGLG